MVVTPLASRGYRDGWSAGTEDNSSGIVLNTCGWLLPVFASSPRRCGMIWCGFPTRPFCFAVKRSREVNAITIPFNKPCVVEGATRYVNEVLASNNHSGDGPFSRKCHELLESLLKAPKVLLTTSCTHALEMAALLLDVRPGDEVIVPSFTFVSTANAFVLRGARPVFADIRSDTLNLDETQLERLVTRRTRAIVPVHYAGVSCEL